jgi:hypothetical protein
LQHQFKNGKIMAEITEKKKATRPTPAKRVSARDRIKPRGLVGAMKGKIRYNEDEDIFNLGL